MRALGAERERRQVVERGDLEPTGTGRAAYLDHDSLLELVGVQFISLGLIGELLTRTYHESQGKSPYLVRTTLNLEPPSERRAA